MGHSGGTGGHVFISYVREDSARVDQLQEILEAAGIPVWRDTARLWPGQDWRMRIRHAITDNALVFLVCFSEASVSRVTSYQNEELTVAIEQLRLRAPDNPWLIPVRFDDSKVPDRSIGGGRTLNSIQRIDLFGNDYGKNAARLTQAIMRLLEVNTGPAPAAQPQVRYSLPPDAEAFTGRGGELDRIMARVADAAAPGGVVTVGAIDGMPGVGKTALAVHVAHALRSLFPDRQLFIDLHAHTPGREPVRPEDALAGLLTPAARRPPD